MVETREEEHEDEGLQMSFLDHLDELRRRLIHSVVAIGIAFCVCFAVSDYIYRFLAIPVKQEARKARVERESKLLGPDTRTSLKEGEIFQYTFPFTAVVEKVQVPAGTTIPARVVSKNGHPSAVLTQPWLLGKTVLPTGTELGEVLGQAALIPGFDSRDELVITTVGGAFSLYMKVGMYAAVAFAIPFLLFQIWAFVSPGLYQHEKKYIGPVLVMGSFLFILGAAFGYYVAFPAACNYLLGLQEGFQTLINAEDYLDLILIIMLGLGIVFQIPTIAFILGRVGLVTPGILWKGWRYAVVIIAILAAVLTPTADAFNMLIFATPMLMLYFLSIGIVWVFGKPRRTDEEMAALAAEK
ncbi:MAG: twin-arginine translocase subunit TatC [Blastocatellia bacterium]